MYRTEIFFTQAQDEVELGTEPLELRAATPDEARSARHLQRESSDPLVVAIFDRPMDEIDLGTEPYLIREKESPDDLAALTPANVGQRVSYGSGSGIYLGVALDEEDGVPYHYFVDGEIRGHAQGSHGFPAAPGTPTTTTLTPTALIRNAEAQAQAPRDDYEPDSREFLDKVETAWWKLMQGDLLLVAPEDDPAAPADRELAELVTHLATVGRENIKITSDGVTQYGPEGAELPQNVVTADEMARRIAAALAVVLYGG